MDERQKLLNYIDKKKPRDHIPLTELGYSQEDSDLAEKAGITINGELWQDLKAIAGIDPEKELHHIIKSELEAARRKR